jgi:hypothetical protein
MIKNIKVTNNKARKVFRDTTNGNVYSATEVPKGSECPDEGIAIEDGLSFKDDVGDWVSIFEDGNGYEVVEETQPEDEVSMTNNNDWSTVDWDEIPEDVEAVVTFKDDEPSYYKVVDGRIQVQCYRSNSFSGSGFDSIGRAIEYFGDRFHLRPTPVTKPTPEVPESTQVETLEVEATTTPEFDWSSVDSDVEAVILYKGDVVQHLKIGLSGGLLMNIFDGDGWIDCSYSTIEHRELFIKHYGDGTATLLRRPPATIPPEYGVDYKWFRQLKERHEKVYQDICSDLFDPIKVIADDTPEAMGFEEVKGSTDLRLKCREAILSKKPSIYTTLQGAQQSILKHHGVTGEVKFTVTCSE